MKFLKLLFVTILSVFIFIIFDSNLRAAVWKFNWYNTKVIVPLGESIEEYKYKPYAILCKDGVALTDAKITYNMEGDLLYYLKNVDTTKAGEYYVWYKAYESKYVPGTCIDYRCKITFVVKDTIKPEIDTIKDIIYLPIDKEYDLNTNIVAKDNYGIKEIIFDTKLDITKCGEYLVDATAVDLGGNFVTKSFKAVVYDDATVPIITCNQSGNDIYIPSNMDYDIKQYFNAIDEKEGDITNRISYPIIDNSSPGEYDYTVSVKNSRGHEAKYTVRLHIVDEVAPTLELTTKNLILDYKTDFLNFNFNQYIKLLDDNLPINYNNLEINYTMENKVGNYILTYSYTDGVYTVTDFINVSLISYQTPKIVVSDVMINEDSNVDLSSFISIYDDSDEYIEDTLEIDDKDVDYSNEGTYYATAYCMNSSGKSSTVKFKVIVTSDSIFSKANIGITITAIILFVLLLGLVGASGIYLYIKKKKSV